MRVIGLTGGIASGKTTVTDLFAALGVPVVDADVAAREVVEPGTPGLAALVEAFGAGVLDGRGRLDRKALRDRVFADADARGRLEAILHPLIEQRLRAQLAALEAPYAILAAPLLLEAGLERLVDRVLVVDAPEALQIQRVMQRDGSSRAQAEAILAAQMGRQARLAAADDVIVNAGPTAALEAEVARLHARYLGAAD